MKFKSEVLTQASGSIGGVTYSHNRGGMYRRARSIPTNPNTALQQFVRNNFALLSQEWGQLLTDAQRNGWDAYAANNPITDRLGDPLLLTGHQMFLRCNSLQMQAGKNPVLDGPSQQGMAMLTPPLVGADVLLQTIIVNLQGTDPWASDDDGALLVYSSRQQLPSINFLRGPMRFAGSINGNAATPPTSAVLVNPFGTVWIGGQKVFWKTIAIRGDGRISSHENGVTVIS